jgi:hypothetical protein
MKKNAKYQPCSSILSGFFTEKKVHWLPDSLEKPKNAFFYAFFDVFFAKRVTASLKLKTSTTKILKIFFAKYS